MTISEVYRPKETELILQGDIFRDVEYVYSIDETEKYVDVTKFTFPLAIVISQSCDIRAMSEMVLGYRVNGEEFEGKTVNFMPSLIMVPLYNTELLKNGKYMPQVISEIFKKAKPENAYSSKEKSVSNNVHYRYLTIETSGEIRGLLGDVAMDFRQYFSVSAEYLLHNRSKRICRLLDCHSHDITQRFANYLSRTAYPD